MSVTKERIDSIYEEISKYRIELAPDPTTLGPKYLQDLIATCRNYTNHVARLVNELHMEKSLVESNLRKKELAFKLGADDLLANDLRVKNLPNIADRQAQINILLRDEHRAIESLKNDVKDIEALEKMVKLVHRELKDTMGEIKVQRALVRDEIDTGRMYGDERSSDKPETALISGGYARPDDIDEAEIERALRGETLTAEEEPTSPVAELPNDLVISEEDLSTSPETPKSDDELVQGFLGTPHPDLLHKTSEPSEEDLVNIFSGI